MEQRETCDDCGREVDGRETEKINEGGRKRYLCEDCFLDRRRKRGSR